MRHAALSGFSIASSVILFLLAVSGCGGGSNDPDSTVPPFVRESRYVAVDTGTPAGARSRLSAVRVETVFLPENAQRLTARWDPNKEELPSPRFEVQVTRFFDADGTTGSAIGEPLEAVSFEKKVPAFLGSPERVVEKGWDFRKPDGDAAPLFAPGGVYLVEVRTPPEGMINERLQTRLFIAPGYTQTVADDDTNGVSIETKAVERESGVQNLNVSPSRTSYVSRASDISFSFEPGYGSPPKNWTVFLRRYKEARDGRPYSETSQPITIDEVSSTRWRARRRNNTLLDPHAVYVIEIRRSGSSGGIRHLFITNGE